MRLQQIAFVRHRLSPILDLAGGYQK